MSRWHPGLVLRSSAAVLIAVLTMITILLVAPAQAHPRPPRPHPSGYVALGDSYAAGEGLAPFEAGTEAGDQCHRSAAQSHPVLLADSGRRAFDDLTSVACSGAVTADLIATRPGTTRAPQLSALDRRTETVTLTVGGNDAGFGPILGDCVFSADPRVVAPGARGCAVRRDDLVSTRIAALAGRRGAPALPDIVPLPVALAQVVAAAPRATIYVTGYPLIFGTAIDSPYGCQVSRQAPLFVAASDATWIRSKASDLNSVIKATVRAARRAGADVHYVDVTKTFRGHELCGRRSPWLNGVVLTSADPPQISAATFHPTAEGQRAYATSVAATARQAKVRR